MRKKRGKKRKSIEKLLRISNREAGCSSKITTLSD
jgi:hypothetical protein